MKRKFSRILGVGLAIALLTSLMVVAAPASASTLLFWAESNIPKTDDYMLGPAGSDVIDLAANGETIYAVGRSHGDNYTITLQVDAGASAVASWDDTQVTVGAMSVKVSAGNTAGDWGKAAFTPPTGITLADMATITTGWSWSYFIDSSEFTTRGTQLELIFSSLTDPDGYAEMTIMDNAYGAFPADPPTLDAWTEQPVTSATTGLVFGYTEANVYFPDFPSGFEGPIADLVDHVITQDPNAGAWELTSVRPGCGWIGASPTTAYIDLVTIDGISYDLERDTATTGQAYQLDGVLYKSSDAGATWSSLVTSTYYPSKSVKLMAVAADDENVVTMVTADNFVYYSSNGGSSWSNLKNPRTDDLAVINDIDVSAGTYRYVVAGGTDGTDAELYTMYLSMAQAWAARAGGAGFASNQDSILAVKFSPNYATDKIILAVSEEGSVGSVLQVFWYETKKWNDQIPGFTTGYPVSLGVPNAIAASIAAPSTYLGNDEAERVVFVGTANTSSGNVMRLIDYSSRSFELWTGADEGQINSIAYNDSSEILLAGSYDDSAVYSCHNPMASYPKFERQNNLKQPGGNSATASKVVVGWSGDNAVAGTSGDESAFAISTDDGYAFNDISLIDTVLTAMDDVAVNADGSKVYLTSSDGTDSSVWLKEGGSWNRVLSRPGVTGTFLVRIAPDDDSAVYVAEQGTQNVWVSKNSGTASWKLVPCYKLTGNIQDFAVMNADTVYAIDDDGCSKTVNAGSSWGTKNSHKVAGYMVTLAPNDDILVGGSAGYMSFSTDAGSTFIKSKVIDSGEKVQVVADKDYDENGTIYAAAGPNVKRSYGSGDTIDWSSRGPDLEDPWNFVGMAEHEGVVYALAFDNSANVSRLYRALNLKPAATSDLALWSYLGSSSDLEAEPQALKMSAGPKFWAIATPNSLPTAVDPIATVGPTLVSPAEGSTVPVNPETGKAYNVTFIWERYSSKYIISCDLQIATDAAFDGVIYEKTFTGIVSDTIAKVVGPTGAEGTNQEMADYMPGSTYYWRVRVSDTTYGPLISPWSEGRSFTAAGATAFEVASPVMGAADVSITPTLTWSQYEGALSYEVEVSDEPTFVVPLISRNTEGTFFQVEEALAYSTSYYWRVRGVTGVWVPKEETAGGPWVTGVFTTMADPAEALPPIIIEKEPAPPAEVKVVEVPVSTPAPIPAALLWAVVLVGAVLVIALIILIVRTRRVA